VTSLPGITDCGTTFPRSGVGDISVIGTSAADELMDRVVSLLLTIVVIAGVLFVTDGTGVVNLFKVIGSGLGSRAFAEDTSATLDRDGREELERSGEDRSFVR
jgi:hypothetical protein